jgi:hypothetical protein
VDEIQALTLNRLRARRDNLMQQLDEVNAQIDAVTDDAKRNKLVAVSPPDWAHLFRYLRELHLDAGEPSSRKVAESSGGMISHTTVSKVLAGTRAPSWKSLLVIGKVLGADEVALEQIWLSCQMRPAATGEGSPTSLLAGTILPVSYVHVLQS